MPLATLILPILKTHRFMDKHDWKPLAIIVGLILIIKYLILFFTDWAIIINFLNNTYVEGIQINFLLDGIGLLIIAIVIIIWRNRRKLRIEFENTNK